MFICSICKDSSRPVSKQGNVHSRCALRREDALNEPYRPWLNDSINMNPAPTDWGNDGSVPGTENLT